MRKRLILLVGDDPDTQRLLGLGLERAGHGVLVAGSLARSREIMGQVKFDLVVLDLLSPDGHGVPFCQEVKASRPRLPVVVISALVHEADYVRRAGADRFFPKLYAPAELEAAVADLLAPLPEAPCEGAATRGLRDPADRPGRGRQ
jgi:two-component system phosphate regulon response regulator OmpR